MKLENIDTKTGNQILSDLSDAGWKLKDQYSPIMFDKGIDFDSYTLRKGDEELYFEWTNWFEWEVQGSAQQLAILIEKYSLEA